MFIVDSKLSFAKKSHRIACRQLLLSFLACLEFVLPPPIQNRALKGSLVNDFMRRRRVCVFEESKGVFIAQIECYLRSVYSALINSACGNKLTPSPPLPQPLTDQSIEFQLE